jgi:hypothetical protein
VAINRKAYNDTPASPRPAVTLAAETLRAAQSVNNEPVRSEEKISLFWRVFGGTLLSITALIVITICQQFSSSINEVRSAVVHLNEVHGDFVRKEDLNSRATSLWNSLKEVNAEVPALKARTEHFDEHLHSVEKEHKELCTQIQALRERLAALEARLPVKSASNAKSGSSDPAD